MIKHTHYMRLESPNGTPTVKGKCACGRMREYPSAGESYIAPAEPGGAYRMSTTIPKDVLADER